MAGAKTIKDADALLVFRVGPVLCCAPTLSIEAVMMPPVLHRPPGSDRNHPGVFRFSSGMVSVVDLRQRFGVDESDWQVPGRMIVTEISGGHAGFMVDEIIDVMQWPQQGWSTVPALVPRQVFKRTLLLNNHIHFYADFEDLFKFRESGYLRAHIAMLVEKQMQIAAQQTLPAVSETEERDIQPSAMTPLPQTVSDAETESKNQFVTEAKPAIPVQANRINTPPSRKPAPIHMEKPDSGSGQKPPVVTGARGYDKPDVELPSNKPVYNVPQYETPVAAVATDASFGQNENGRKQKNESSDTASGNLVLVGIVVALLTAITLMMPLFKTPEITKANKPEPEIRQALQTEREVESAPARDFQASITRDAEGIVITIDSASEELPHPQQARDITPDKLPVAETIVSPTSVAAEKVIVHVVKKGDTLWAIANRYVRDPWRYPELAKLSNIKNPHRIYPGNKVKIIMRTVGKTDSVESRIKSK